MIKFKTILQTISFCLLITSEIKAQSSSPVLLEYFSSEACSSCPAADKVISKFIDEHQDAILLSFQVDYFNSRSWADRFSNKAYSLYQNDYSKKLGQGVYTPQLILNGQSAFVGSESSTLDKEFAKFNKVIPNHILSNFKVKKEASTNKLSITGQIKNSKADWIVRLAFITKDNISNVTGGENAGRKIKHRNVVREFIGTNASNQYSYNLTDPIQNDKNKSLVIYIQDKNSKKILDACKIEY